MGHDHLRDDKECQNCGHIVEEIYCPHCGQKNIETRQSFGHLVGHFVEDLTHYDGAFWKTIKYLLFRPAFLTQEYLMGKRQLYVPPVKLYIFISFLVFFIPAILPDLKEATDTEPNHTTEKHTENKVDLTKKEDVWILDFITTRKTVIYNTISYKSEKEMDSIELLKPDSLRLSPMERVMGKKLIQLYSHNTPEQLGEKFSNNFNHNIPKIIFLYMPIFAFWLWVFHSKKHWYFFDHGIFTLHYFSFLLLNMTFMKILVTISRTVSKYCNEDINSIVQFIFGLIGIFYFTAQIYYFYRAHRKMYHESWIINFIKSTLMFIINIISILFISLVATYFTLYNLH